MKKIALAATLTALTLTLTACGNADDDAGAASTGESAAAARTITDQYGQVTINGTPARIVTPGNWESDTLVALGIMPVAMGQWLEEPDGASPWRRELLKGLQGEPPKIIKYNANGYDVEETLAFRPDLVIAGFDMEENPYRQLSERVPTISMKYETAAEDFTTTIGTAVGRDQQAEKLIADTRAKVAETKAKYPKLDGMTAAIVDAGDPGVLNEASKSTIGLGMLEQLGLKAAPGVAAVEDYAPVPAEKWSSTFNGDLLVVSYPDAANQAEVEKNKFFQAIPAVQAGRYLAVVDHNETELLRSVSLPQVQWSLTNFVPKLAAAVE